MTHEAKMLKINDLIDNGEEHKIKWNELLAPFASLSEDRMIHALSLLTPSQLASIQDATSKSIEAAKERQYESIKLRMLSDGIDAEDFVKYLQENPSVGSRGRRLSQGERNHRDDIINQMLSQGEKSPKLMHDKIIASGLVVSYASVAARVKTLSEEAQ
ncbi:hypothetical protein JCM19235_1331 [Vibrio maritimus]|uniref:Uncharacterized protein n=1 Tax=Vibrio maritimus TaxID=990268 RepID=A0A090S5Q7_9VIBR|nr:hypothetical protein JCM19235_1331 [Vibrio maritimus]